MGQKKLKRFAEIATFNNVFEYPTDTAGNWSEHFQNQYPINISQYTRGIYLLTIMTGEIKKTNTYKIIKQ